MFSLVQDWHEVVALAGGRPLASLARSGVGPLRDSEMKYIIRRALACHASQNMSPHGMHAVETHPPKVCGGRHDPSERMIVE